MPMSPGALLLQVRQTFQHGVRAAYYRDVVRPRILSTPPVEGTNDTTCGIHVLTSLADWVNLVWTLKSFYRASNRYYALTIHDDGSLTPEVRDVLHQHFPDGRIITRAEADATVLPTLADYPRCRAFRETNHLSPKLFDFRHFLLSDRMLLLDSDVLFFSRPSDLLDRIENPKYRKNSVNRDVSSAYTVSFEDALRYCNVRLEARFNSGLGLIHRDSLRLDWFEEFLGLPGVLDHFWRIEQTLFALCSSRFGVELLPSVYDVHLGAGSKDKPCRHYVGSIRHQMYEGGIRQLVKSGILNRDLKVVHEKVA